jgi:hypothetical protein
MNHHKGLPMKTFIFKPEKIFFDHTWGRPSAIIFFSIMSCAYLAAHFFRFNYYLILLAISSSYFISDFVSRKFEQPIAKKYQSKKSYSLEFGKENLIFKEEKSIKWHIPYHRISHIELNPFDATVSKAPAVFESNIITNDNDSYPLGGTIEPELAMEIQQEIEKAKSQVLTAH